MSDDGVKRCSSCGEEKPLDAFRDRTRRGRRSECRDCERERNRRYRAANAEKIRERQRRYHAQNAEKERERSRRYHAQNAEKIRESKRRYLATPEARALRAAQAARSRGAIVVEIFDPYEIFERDGWRCWICRGAVDRQHAGIRGRGEPTLDHIVPCKFGGAHSRENVRLAHRDCNVRRDRAAPKEAAA